MDSSGAKRLILLLPLLLLCTGILATEYCITEISIFGNKRTKPPVILRELPFSAGDRLSGETLRKKLGTATENLYNASLFNYVNITYQTDSAAPGTAPTPCRIIVQVEERWYYWPLVNVKLEDRNMSSWMKNFDFSRITFDLGIKMDNVWGLGHKFAAGASFGFEKGINLSYTNVVLDPRGRHTFGAAFYALYNKTVNVISESDRPVFIKSGSGYLSRSVGGEAAYTYRPQIRTKYELTLGYGVESIADTVLQCNPDYWGASGTVSRNWSLVCSWSRDYRNYKVYPTAGYFTGIRFRGHADDDFRFFYGQIYADLQYYHKLSRRWTWDAQLKAGVSLKNRRAYIYDRAIGYEKINVAGYDHYAVDGQHFAALGNNLRFLILPTRVVTLNFLRGLSKFNKIHFTLYGKVFADMGYVSNNHSLPDSRLANTFLFGSGAGIDLLTYYDIVLSVSYAVNKNGENGFFFGIKSPIF